MQVHPDLIEDNKPWTTVSQCKSSPGSKGKSKAKTRLCNVISIAATELDSEANKLTDNKDEAQAFAQI